MTAWVQIYEEMLSELRTPPHISTEDGRSRFARDTPPAEKKRIVSSLRRVIARFCIKSQCFPRRLFREDIHLPVNTHVYAAGAYGDVYVVSHSSGAIWALKTFRVFINPHVNKDVEQKKVVSNSHTYTSTVTCCIYDDDYV